MHDARALLDHIPALQRPCDLDLLLFFARHWRALLSNEQLARLLGYPLKEIARSRDVLVAAGLLTPMQDPRRAERMYVFESDRINDVLPAILALASTPGGRLTLRRTLTSDYAGSKNNLSAQVGNPVTPQDEPPHRNSETAKPPRPSERLFARAPGEDR
jgi:hypothetical protein